MKTRLSLRVRGIVQGVGFRPFIYRLVQAITATGFVFNDDDGVFIEIQADKAELDKFLREIKTKLPPAALISEMVVKDIPIKANETVFIIKPSPPAVERKAYISPDLAICEDCKREILDKDDRRYLYPFTNCTNCGPRFSIVKDIPYDRKNTTMNEFIMCEKCQKEYQNPLDRRFHAQPNACADCGPQYSLLDKNGKAVVVDNKLILQSVHQLLKTGKIVAVKGIGGYHLVCDAYNEQAVQNLRSRKRRFDKALAVMAGSMTAIEKLCTVSAKEKELLQSPAAPIVLLAKKNTYNLAASVAPGNEYLGIMLPYAPIHCLLLENEDVFVMTSANITEEPIAYKNDDALTRLNDIADYFLIHNRIINTRIDDSVVRVINNETAYIRRSRGFAPSPLLCNLNISKKIVFAAGSQLKNTFCFLKDNKAFISHHIGDLANKAANDAYKEAIEHYKNIFSLQPHIAACDMHPEYFSSKYAHKLSLPIIEVQHHHAHIASVLAENEIKDKVIGISLDGTGYGDDGNLWGGEFFVCDCASYERRAHFAYLPLPGGSKAIKEPWRIAVYLLDKLYGEKAAEKAPDLWNMLPDNWPLAVQIAKSSFNTPLSSSAGRLFDAAAAVLGIRSSINYEGQAAIELEQLSAAYRGKVLPYRIKNTAGIYQVDMLETFAALMENNVSVNQKAADFHMTMARAIYDMAAKLQKETGLDKLVLSGGVFQNITLVKLLFELLADKFTIYMNRKVPANDGGLSLGQAVIASNCYKKII